MLPLEMMGLTLFSLALLPQVVVVEALKGVTEEVEVLVEVAHYLAQEDLEIRQLQAHPKEITVVLAAQGQRLHMALLEVAAQAQ
jgi:hypothetical protein